MSVNAYRINSAADAMINQEGYGYTAGFLVSQLVEALQYMPKTKQKLFMEQLERTVGSKVTVKVRNILNPDAGEIDLPWNLVGTCCDPSTERYHCM
jgi:hypothetical protein